MAIAGGREGNKNRITSQSREFFSQFLDLLNNDESVRPGAIRHDRPFLRFRLSKEKGILPMARILITLTLLCSILLVQVNSSYGQMSQGNSSSQSVNQVLQWNGTLLVIVRTPGAQPATIHPTRSFAIMHAAIYDAVNAMSQ